MDDHDLTPEEMEQFRLNNNLPEELTLLQVIDLTLRLIITAPVGMETKVEEMIKDLLSFTSHPDLKRHDLEGIKASIEEDARAGRDVLNNSLAATGKLDAHE